MHPQIHLNYPAILAAVVANFLFGWLWYGPLFGKSWAKEMGMPLDMKPQPGVMVRGMVLMVIGSFLTAYVLAHGLLVWRPSVWGVGLDAPDYLYGFVGGFFTWIGYYVPMILGAVAWENKSWKLFSINAAYHFLALQLVGMILAYWR